MSAWDKIHLLIALKGCSCDICSKYKDSKQLKEWVNSRSFKR